MTGKNYDKLQNGSDIRGVALPGVPGEDVNLTEEAAADIADGFLLWLLQHTKKMPCDLTVTVGRDPRLSGRALSSAFCGTLLARGIRVIDCGLTSTPAMFMSTVFDSFRADGAVMITASHLPFNRNGLKFFAKEGGLEKTDISAILAAAASPETDSRLCTLGAEKSDRRFRTEPTRGTAAASGAGTAQRTSASPGEAEPAPSLMTCYADHLKNIIRRGIGGNSEKPLTGLKIAVDAGNGSGGFYARDVLEPLGADISASRYLDPDGNFPNHIPNPENAEAMAAVTDAVVQGGCDLGIIFDTDVDRSAAVDENGRAVNKNGIVAMAASLIADDFPGTTVVTDSITSDELTEYLEKTLGLRHLRYKRGYRNVIDKAIELNEAGVDAQLAIETSGHAAFRENYFLDDGAYLAAKIVIRTALLAKKGKKISSLIADLKEPAESREVRMPVLSDDVSAAGDKVLDFVRRWIAEDAQDVASMTCLEIPDGVTSAPKLEITVAEPNYEGIRVSFRGPMNGWFLLRKSLHDPIMPLNIEAEEAGGVEKIASLLRVCLEHIPEIDCSAL